MRDTLKGWPRRKKVGPRDLLVGQTDLFLGLRDFFRPESALFYGNWHFHPGLGVYGRGRFLFRAAWETSFEVVVDRVRAGHAALGRLAHVLVEGEVAHIVVAVRQHDGVLQAFADRGDLTQAGQQVGHQLAVFRHLGGVEEARDQISAARHVGGALFIKGQRVVGDARQALFFLFGEVDGDAVEGGFERHDGVNDGGLLGRSDFLGYAIVRGHRAVGFGG